MGTVTTTTVLDSLRYPSESQIDRYSSGTLWMLKRTSSTQVDLYYSTNNGTSWTIDASFTRSNLQEISGIFIDAEDNISVCYRVYESGEDRIYYRRIKETDSNWRSELLVASATAGSAGAVYTGCSVVNFKLSSTIYVFMAIGTRNGVNSGVTLFAATINSSDTFTVKNTLIDGYRQWLNGPDGVVHPTLDFKHTGNGKAVGSGPALWVAWGRGTLYCIKASWSSGPSWYGPWTPTTVVTGLTSQDYNIGRYNGYGDKFHIAYPSGSTVVVVERKVDDSGGTSRTSSAHPQGVVRYVAISNSSSSNSYRVYAVGTSNNDLYYIDYSASGGTWGSWTLVTATDIVGTVPNNFSVRRNNYGNGQYDLLIAGGTTPYTITHTSSTSASAPNTPVITSPENGSAADVAQTLTLTWTFTDDDPLDSQSAYAIKRVIGAAITYWNNGTTSWQVGEVFNTSSTTSKTFSASWGSDSDAAHYYSVKVRDQATLTSSYSNSIMVIPAAKINPTLTSPGASVTTPNVTVSWTVSSQSAYRVVLKQGSISVYDSGFVDSAVTSVTIPYTLVNAGSYSVELTTRNAEGLDSNTVSQAFTVTFTPPMAATMILTPVTDSGVIQVSVTNPDPTGSAPNTLTNNIYRREVGETDEGVLVASGLNVSTPVPNLLSDNHYGAESGVGWVASTNVVVDRSTTQALEGSYSTTFTSVAGGHSSALSAIGANAIPTASGILYTFSVYARAGTTPRVIHADLLCFNASNVVIGGATNFFTGVADTNTGWTLFQGSALSYGGADCAKFSVSLYVLNAGAGEVQYFDRAKLSLASAVGVPVTYDDFTVASGVDYEYRVASIAANTSEVYSAWAA